MAVSRSLPGVATITSNRVVMERRCPVPTAACPGWRRLFVEDVGEQPAQIVQSARQGIPHGRDEHLEYRFVDAAYAHHCTRNPLRRGQRQGSELLHRPATMSA